MNLFRKIGVAEGMENSRRQEVWKSRGDGQRRDESQRGVHFEGGDVAVIFEDSGDQSAKGGGAFWREKKRVLQEGRAGFREGIRERERERADIWEPERKNKREE